MRPDDLPEVKAALAARWEDLAEHLLGAPSLRGGRTWRWGSKGSLAVEVRGPQRGTWFDHEAGQGGGPLDLIMSARRCGIADAITWAKSWCGISSAPIDPAEAEQRARARKQAAADRDRALAAEHARRRQLAAQLHADSVPVAGTLAERYLIQTRGITPPQAGWPVALRYHAPSRALLLAATDDAGTLHGVQRVLLTPQATKLACAVPKPSTGVFDGAEVRLPGPPDQPLLRAEGPETGLSVWSATGFETRICLGSIARRPPPPDRLTVICRDDDPRHRPGADPRHTAADRRLAEALAAWREAGLPFVVATPWRSRTGNRTDFNDALREAGPEAVRSRIRRALATLPTMEAADG